MTRHTITEDFDNRDVTLSKGDIVILLENDRYGEKGYGGDKYSSGLEKAGGYYHVMVKTRHGRKVRIPRHILSKDCVQFYCQLCETGPMSAYRDYVDHMIDSHLRVQLLRGLDMSKKNPACPFPSCHGISWPIVDNLLFHYASHHNVLEKVVMYESEMAAQELRAKLRSKEETIDNLAKELDDLRIKKTPGAGGTSKDGKKDQDVREEIQGAREMRVIMEQLKEEIENLKRKISMKNSTIKSLKEDFADAKKEVKDAEKKYEHECRLVQSMKNEIKTLESRQEAAAVEATPSSNKKPKQEDKRVGQGSLKDGKGCKEGEDGVSSSGALSPVKEEPSTSQDSTAADANIKAMKDQIELLKTQIQTLKSQNESLQMEIKNFHLQNENLKNIIEIGKSTVETAKKISQEVAEENKAFKEKEIKLSNDLQASESNLQKSKNDNQILQDKLAKVQEKNLEDLNKLQGHLATKDNELSKTAQDLSALKETLKQEENAKIFIELKRDEFKTKFSKCRENCRTIEDTKKSLENDYKALLAENKNAASEIKTLKSHLSSSRAIVVEKAVAKDEINKIKSELTSKTIEVEKANIKLKKLGQQLSTSATEFKSLTELKISQEKEIKELREKVKISSNQDAADNLEKKAKDEEISNLSEKLRNCEDGKSELQERLDFYIQQCSVFEKNDSRHQDEIKVLQDSIKSETVENSSKLEKMKETIQSLEKATVFYKDQNDVLLGQNENLKKELQEAKTHSQESDDKNLLLKYKKKCDMVDELVKKQEKMSAQIRRKDWEIENYQKKLVTAFEAGMSIATKEGPSETVHKLVAESSSSQDTVLDLSTKMKEDTNNNAIKTEKSNFLRNRKYSELSDCSNVSDSVQQAQQEKDAARIKEASNGTGQEASSLKRAASASNLSTEPEAKKSNN